MPEACRLEACRFSAVAPLKTLRFGVGFWGIFSYPLLASEGWACRPEPRRLDRVWILFGPPPFLVQVWHWPEVGRISPCRPCIKSCWSILATAELASACLPMYRDNCWVRIVARYLEARWRGVSTFRSFTHSYLVVLYQHLLSPYYTSRLVRVVAPYGEISGSTLLPTGGSMPFLVEK